MLDLKFIRSHMESIREMLRNRRYDLDLSAFENIDRKRREILPVVEELRHRRNKVSEEIALMKKKGADASTLIADMKKVSQEIKERETLLVEVDEELKPFLMVMPNVPLPSVPVGADAGDNPVVSTWGETGKVGFDPLPHWVIV